MASCCLIAAVFASLCILAGATKPPPLGAWLDLHGLGQYTDLLSGIGAESVSDLTFLNEDDFDKMGMKKVHKRKLLGVLAEEGAADADTIGDAMDAEVDEGGAEANAEVEAPLDAMGGDASGDEDPITKMLGSKTVTEAMEFMKGLGLDEEQFGQIADKEMMLKIGIDPDVMLFSDFVTKMNDQKTAKGSTGGGRGGRGGRANDAKVKRTSRKSYRERLVAIYEKHNPEKVDKVDDLLKKYKGREGKLLRKIEKKYQITEKDEL